MTRVLVLTHQRVELPESVKGLTEKDKAPWKTEYDVVTALKKLGHETKLLGGAQELADIRTTLSEWKPNITFNLMEEFRGEGIYVPYVLGYLQLMRQPFTGCNPIGLQLADDKALTKKLLRYHRIPAPDFAVFFRGRKNRRPRRLSFPLIVKSSTEHGSMGIAQASLVTNDEKLAERVEFIHAQLGTDAMAEEYIEGRELYAGVLGNQRLETFPVWEMRFENLAEGAPRIATERIKWDLDYQKKRGIKTGAAKGLPEGTDERVWKLCRRIYRILGLNGYARMDFRLTEDGKLSLLEPNPNPDLAKNEDFARSAKAAGIPYEQLVRRILNLGLRRRLRGR
ncbi:MAG: ATP-grasp domain-containing protein [Gemmatimonadetes bacterium]|nr:ATP-grasp domain-containing protein [Gemmatimonadota bacterium]